MLAALRQALQVGLRQLNSCAVAHHRSGVGFVVQRQVDRSPVFKARGGHGHEAFGCSLGRIEGTAPAGRDVGDGGCRCVNHKAVARIGGGLVTCHIADVGSHGVALTVHKRLQGRLAERESSHASDDVGCAGLTVQGQAEGLPIFHTAGCEGDGAACGCLCNVQAVAPAGREAQDAGRIAVKRHRATHSVSGTGIAGHVCLSDLNSVGSVSTRQEREAAARAWCPCVAAVGAVLPSGIGFQARHVHRACACDAIAVTGARVRGQD